MVYQLIHYPKQPIFWLVGFSVLPIEDRLIPARHESHVYAIFLLRPNLLHPLKESTLICQNALAHTLESMNSKSSTEPFRPTASYTPVRLYVGRLQERHSSHWKSFNGTHKLQLESLNREFSQATRNFRNSVTPWALHGSYPDWQSHRMVKSLVLLELWVWKRSFEIYLLLIQFDSIASSDACPERFEDVYDEFL